MHNVSTIPDTLKYSINVKMIMKDDNAYFCSDNNFRKY